MKFFLFLLLLHFPAISQIQTEAGSTKVDEKKTFTARIGTDKKAYLPGETVKLTVTIENAGEESITIQRITDANEATSFYVASDGGEFEKYVPVYSNIDSFRHKILKPGELDDTTGTLLWNYKVKIGHLSPMAAANARKGKIFDHHAFPSPGKYLIKAHTRLIRPLVSLRCDPIEIEILEPEGDDAEVWKLMEKRHEISRFVQSLVVPLLPIGREARFLSEMDAIVARYPNGVLSKQLAERLKDYREQEAEKLEIREKLKKSRSIKK